MRSISTSIRGLAISFFAVALLNACGGGGGSPASGGGSPGTTGTAPPTSALANNLVFIDVAPGYSIFLVKGLTQQFTATGYYSNGSVQNLSSSVTWNSLSPAIVTVDAKGLATGAGTGSTNISASLGGVTSNSVSLTVSPAVVKNIALTPANSNTSAGLSTQFTATGIFTDGTVKDITAAALWSSSNTAVATFNIPGLALAVSAGTATISASADSVSSSATLTVANYTVSGTLSLLPAGSSVVLQNNGTDNLSLAANGTFVFNTPIAPGAYSVSVLTQPAGAGHPCNVVNGSGTITNTYISAVQVVCGTAVGTVAGSTSLAGLINGTGTAASFGMPVGIALDAAGNLYVADASHNVIRQITPAGVVSTFAGSGSVGSADGTGTGASFNSPQGIAVDKATGNVYVGDTYNNLIRKITPAGVVSTFAGSGAVGSTNATGTAASFYWPSGLTVDTAGNVYSADSASGMIRVITPAGVVSTLAGSGAPGSTNATGTAASFRNPNGVAVDTAGNVYVADSGNNLIRKITPGGVVSTLAGTAGVSGSADGTGTAATFSNPWGVAVDTAGNVYVADSSNNLIRKITPAGVVSTLAGAAGAAGAGYADGPALSARFYMPYGVASDTAGNLYIADSWNRMIRKIVP